MFDLIAIGLLIDRRKSNVLFLLHKQNITKYITKLSLIILFIDLNNCSVNVFDYKTKYLMTKLQYHY